MAISLSTDPNEIPRVSNDPSPLPSFTPDLVAEDDHFEADLMRPALEAEAQERAELQTWRDETRAKVDESALGLESFLPGQSEAVKRRVLIRKVLESEMDLEPTSSMRYRMGRAQAADKLFGGEGRESDEAFYAQIHGRATEAKEKRDFHGELKGQALLSVFTGWSKFDAPWGKAAKENEAYQKNPFESNRVFRDQQKRLMEEYDDILVDVRELNRAIKEDDTSFAQAFDLVSRLDDEQLHRAAKLLGSIQRIEGATESDRGVGGNLKESAERDTENLAGKAFRGGLDIVSKGLGFGSDSQYVNSREAAESVSAVKEEEINRERAEGFLAEVRRFRDQRDPIRLLADDDTFLQSAEKALYASPGVGVTIAAGVIPGAGQVATLGLLKNSAKEQLYLRALDAGVERQESLELAEKIAGPLAAFQYLPERIGLGAVTKKLPALAKLQDKLPDFLQGKISRAVTGTLARGTAETTTEEIQAIMGEMGNDVLAVLKEEIPGADWDAHWETFGSRNLETFLSIAPYAATGSVFHAGDAQERQKIAEEFAKASDSELLATGATPEAVDKVRKARGPAERVLAVEQLIEDLEPGSDLAKEAGETLAKEEEVKRELEADAIRAGALPRIEVTTEGITLRDATTGEAFATVETAAEAAEAIEDYTQMNDGLSGQRLEYLQTMIEAADITLKGDGETRKSMVELRLGEGLTVAQAAMESAENAERARVQMEIQEKLGGGDGSMTRLVLGSSKTEFEGRQRRTLNRLNGGASVLTVFHEDAHGLWREALSTGRLTKDEAVSFFRSLDASIQDKVDKNGRSLRFLADGEVTDTMIDEAVAEFMEVEVLRTRKGDKTKAGVISRNLSAIAKTSTAGGKFMAFVRAMRGFFETALSRHLHIKRSLEDGTLKEADLETFRQKLQGTEAQEEYEEEVKEEYEKNFVPSEEEGSLVESFSISPAQDAEYLSAVESGDMETAQEMVDEAAKAAGYDSPKVYHGSKSKVDVFSKEKFRTTDESLLGRGFYFTYNKNEAESISETVVFGEGDDPTVISAYLKIKNPLTIIDWKLPDGRHLRELHDGFSITRKGSDAVENAAKEAGSDSVIMEKKGGGIGHVAVFNPNQIKSADPVTYDENGNVIPLSERFNESRDEISFSLGDSAIADALIGDVSKRIKRPEARARWFGDISRRLKEVRHEANRMKQVFGKEDQKVVVDPRAMKSLKKEAAMRQVLREEELEREIWESGDARALAAGDPMTLKEMPVHGAIARPGKKMSGGELESKSAFMKRTKRDPGAEYEGSEGMVGALLYGGNRSPDQMAQELHEQGILPDAEPATMWEALRTERASVKDVQDQFREALKMVRGAKKQAKLETDKWLEEQKALQLRDQNPMERMRRSLKMLDAILMALPPELRGRVGGFVQLANVSTDEARLKELLKRVDKIDEVVEKHLRKEFGMSAKRLLERASAARQEAGKSDRGKHDVLLHQMFDRVKAAMELDGPAVKSMVKGLETEREEREASGTLTAAQDVQLEQMALLVELFGDWKNATAADREAALVAGWRVFDYGFSRSVLEKTVRREAWQKSRNSLIVGTGKSGIAIQRDEMSQQEESWKNFFAKVGQGFMDFGQALGWTFGQHSQEAQRFEEWEREADYQKKDRMFDHQTAIENFWTELAGGDPVAGLKMQYAIQTEIYHIKAKKGKSGRPFTERQITLGQMIQARMMWRQPDGRRHMEGHEGTVDQEGGMISPPSEWAYTQEFMDAVDALMTPEARALEDFLTEQYGEEYADLNAVHERMYGIELPKNPLYSPLTVSPLQGKGGDMIDPLTGQVVSEMNMAPTSIIRRSQSAIAEPRFLDALHTFYGHKTQIEHWMAYAELSKELNVILNNREVKNSVEAKSGVEGLNTLAKWQEVLSKGGVRDSAMTIAAMQKLQRGMGRLAQAALVGRVSVLAIQSTQLGASLAHMPTGSYLKRVGKLAAGKLNWMETMKSEFIQRRMKEAPPAVRMAMEQMRTAEPSKAKYLANKMGSLISGADAFFTAATYAIIYDYQTTKLGLSPEAAHAEAEKLTEQVAQPVRAGKRSLFENTAKNPFVTLAWAFSSEPRQKIMLAAYAGFTGRTKSQKARALAVAWGFGGAMAAVVRAIMADSRDDDDDELFDEKHWNPARLTAQTLAGPLSGVPVAGDLLEGGTFKLFRLLGMEPGYLPEGNLMDSIPKGGDAAVNVATGESFEDLDTLTRDVDKILNGVAPFNDSAAAYSSFMHFARDVFRLGKNTIGD